MSPDSHEDPDITHLRQAIDLAARARTRGDHPFGSLLVAPDGSVVAEAMNSVDTSGDPTGHAETNVVRAVGHLDLDTRAELTLYTSTEPCAMCAGAIYWAGVGTVVYALGEDDLREMTGDDPANPTLAMPCRRIFEAGSRPIVVRGPFAIDAAHEVHDGFWQHS
ncbi:nucleoside deaminase [Gordonia hongkongensis]|uniref:Nucleoside deaminase n=1 Tax=Gordonia hongkongensis TaxID=1701090 RepID=A0ABT6BYG6_9ACTN|nr:nucleoside deaminase [Gordonia hongkongensis]MDF6102866.1 nucleoside deaminase [Gordonia hongkongensis]OCW86119.1 tRNA-specific adenosine deaminase [Nocardia farcinica]